MVKVIIALVDHRRILIWGGPGRVCPCILVPACALCRLWPDKRLWWFRWGQEYPSDWSRHSHMERQQVQRWPVHCGYGRSVLLSLVCAVRCIQYFKTCVSIWHDCFGVEGCSMGCPEHIHGQLHNELTKLVMIIFCVALVHSSIMSISGWILRLGAHNWWRYYHVLARHDTAYSVSWPGALSPLWKF